MTDRKLISQGARLIAALLALNPSAVLAQMVAGVAPVAGVGGSAAGASLTSVGSVPTLTLTAPLAAGGALTAPPALSITGAPSLPASPILRPAIAVPAARPATVDKRVHAMRAQVADVTRAAPAEASAEASHASGGAVERILTGAGNSRAAADVAPSAAGFGTLNQGRLAAEPFDHDFIPKEPAKGEPKELTPQEAADLFLAAEVKERSAFVKAYREEFAKAIVGQEDMRDSILMGLLTGGHILLEGVPGLAKTRAVKAVTAMLELEGARIQFTRDLLPSDITGQEELDRATGEWKFRKGRIFTNVLLADEINRAKGTTQGGLLEAMEEKQITVAGMTYRLQAPFLVLATQNPIEEDGVHPLPKAQLDRFMFKVHVSYPTEDQLSKIVDLNLAGEEMPVKRILSKAELEEVTQTVRKVIVADDIKAYIGRLVTATRPDLSGAAHVRKFVRTGVSPRAAIWLARSAQAHAFIHGRHYVVPEDVKAVAHRVLRHRIILQFEAEGQVTADQVVDQILTTVPSIAAKTGAGKKGLPN